MKNITEIQLAIQQKLEQQLRDLYALDAKVASLEPDSAQSIESLEQTLVEEVKSRSLKLTRHLARSEHNTKELIRLELEQERLQNSNTSQQYQLSALQNSVHTARQHHQSLVEKTTALEEESNTLQAQYDSLVSQKNALEEALIEQRNQCNTLQEEVDGLQRKSKHLQQNIDGLLQQREEGMLSIMDLTARLSDVSSGKE